MHFFLFPDIYLIFLFITLSAPLPFIFRVSFFRLGTVKPAARVAGGALDAGVEQPVQWAAAGVCFSAGPMELGSAGLALSCLQTNRKSTALGWARCHLLMEALGPWFLE